MERPPSVQRPWGNPAGAPWIQMLRRWYLRRSPPSDPLWRLQDSVHWPELASEAARDFRVYLEGVTQVRISSLDDVCDWLFACRYVSDRRLVDRQDHWQHPVEFEQRRRGDCEDHALWGWRQIRDLGLPVEFVLGLFKPGPQDVLANHAWLHVHDGRELLLLETTATRRELMVQRLQELSARYIPTASIDHQLRTYYFANYFHVRRHGRALGCRA